jgi:hypothetical protein
MAVPLMEIYASIKFAIEGLTAGLRRSLLPWGITVICIHPSSVTGTQFTKHMKRGGTVRYMPVPMGRIKREWMARHIVGLIERPLQALCISRVYEVPVLINKLLPGMIERLSARWVPHKRKSEIPPTEQIQPVEYRDTTTLTPLWLAAGSVGMLAIVFHLLTGKSSRWLPGKTK